MKRAIVLIGPHQGQEVEILKIEYGTGAMNGWFTVKLENGKKLLYAGEELQLIQPSPDEL